MEDNPSLIGTLRNSKEILPQIKNATLSQMQNTVRSLGERSYSLNVSGVAAISRENFFGTVSPSVALKIQQNIELHKQKDYRESPFNPNSFKVRNLSVQQSLNKGNQSPFIQSNDAKVTSHDGRGIWSPGREYGLLEMHKKLNAHNLMFKNGNEIDLTQSRMITQAKPLKGSQNHDILKGIFQSVNQLNRISRKDTILSVRNPTSEDKISILSESSEAHLKKLVHFAEKEKRFASMKSRDITTKKSDVLNQSYAEIGEQIEKLQSWNIAQPVVSVAKSKNYSMTNKAVTQTLERHQKNFSLPSLISPSRFALGSPSLVTQSKDGMPGTYQVIESRRAEESILKRTMLKPAEQIITDIQMPELSEDFELCLDHEQIQSRRFMGQESKRSILVVDNHSYHNDFMMEKREEIQNIIKKRQRKAALLAAFKNSEGRGKPNFMNFSAKHSQSGLELMKISPEKPNKPKLQQVQQTYSDDEGQPIAQQQEIDKEDPITREIHQKLIDLRSKREKVAIYEPDRFRDGPPQLATEQRADIQRIKDIPKMPIIDTKKRQAETNPVTPKSGILKRGTEIEAISDVMRFDGSKVAELLQSQQSVREIKTKQVMIVEPLEIEKIKTSMNDTSQENQYSEATPFRSPKMIQSNKTKKSGDMKSESKSPKNKSTKALTTKLTDKNLSIKVISQHSQPFQTDQRRNSMISVEKPQSLQEPEEDQTSFDTERSFYSSHKSTFDTRDQIKRKKTNLNLIKEMMEEEHVSQGSLSSQVESATKKSAKQQSESDQQSPAQSHYSEEVNQQLRIMRRQERERQEIEDQEYQKLCGPRLVHKVDALISNLKAGSTYDDADNQHGLMLQSGNTSLFNAQMHANTNQDKMHKYIKIFGDGVKKDLSFFSICKQAQNSNWSEQDTDEPKVKFFKECMRDKTLALPIMTKIFDGVLIIRNFKINQGLARAIYGQLIFQNNQVQKLYLENNGVDGNQLALILEGISVQHAFSNLTIQENQLNEVCIENISILLKNRMPNNLEDLHILFCKINQPTTEMLLTSIRTRSQLKRLSLVQANLNEKCIKKLAEIMTSQKSIISLDISWNQIPPNQIMPLLEVLSKHRRLQYLNLSWNNIIDQEASEKDQEIVLNMLGKMIKHNQNLLHLDLSGSGLSPFIIEGIGNCLRKAKSLLCIHLSGNPGLTQEMQESLSQRIHCRPQEDMERFSRINSLVQKVMKKLSKKNKNLESVKNMVDRHQDFSIYRKDPVKITDKFIIQRVLGHKEDQPGSGQWFETSNTATSNFKHTKFDCWLCQGHIFSVIFWSRKMAHRLKPVLTQDEAEPIRFEIDQIEMQDGEHGFAAGNLNYNELENKQPYISGSMTGWRYKKMIPLHEFTASFDKKPRDFFEIAYDMRKIRRKVQHADECNVIEKRWIEICRLSERLRYTYHWQQFFKQGMKYKKPFIINGHMFREPPDLNGQIDDQGKLITDESIYGVSRKELGNSSPSSRKTVYEGYATGEIHLTESDSDTELEEQRQKVIADRKVAAKKKIVKTSEEEKKEELPDLPDVDKFDTVWVLPFFGKPGIHSYMIKYKDTEEQQQKRHLRQIRKYERRQTEAKQYKRRELNEIELELMEQARIKVSPEIFFYDLNVPRRSEDVPHFAKTMKNNVVERVYDRDATVFGRWRVDNENSLQTLVREDLKFWKAAKFVKVDEDRLNCEKIIMKYIVKLKEIFVNLICQGNYPTLSQLDCGSFANKSKIIGAQVESSAVDRAFIAAKAAPEGVNMPQSNGNSLCRAQFWELILRLAQTKYKENKIFETFAESLETLITDFILQFYPIEPWQSFRDDYLWCIEVNDVFEANLNYLKSIYDSFTNQNKKFLEINDLIQLCLQTSPCGVSEMDVRFCFGMCKMTIVMESQGYKEYTKLQFVEFLEFIGRLAYSKFKHSNSDMQLAEKIEALLDDLLPGYGYTRKEVEIAVEEFSESDDDY